MSNNKNSKVINFLNGKTFYVVLSIFFIAIGVAAWAGMRSMKEAKDNGRYDNMSSTLSQTQNNGFSSTQSTSSSSNSPDSSSTTSDSAKLPETDNDNTVSDSEAADSAVANFFIPPVVGETLKNFSDEELQYSMTYGDLRLHKALDITADTGTPVTASGNGKVTDVYTDPLLGAVVEIDHGNGITARYCGLNATPTVNVGDIVYSSTQIGAIDVIPSESVEPRHLHLEFYLNGKAVSPSKYFTQN